MIRRIVNKDFDRQRMIDRVAAVVRVMLIRLYVTVCILGPGHQGVPPRLLRSMPVELPTSPRMRFDAVEEFRLRPGLPAVRAHRDPRYLGLACPRSAENLVVLVRGKRFVNSRSGDL